MLKIDRLHELGDSLTTERLVAMQTIVDPRPGLFIGSTTYQIKDTKVAMDRFADPLTRRRTKDAGSFKIPALPHGETSDSHWVDEQLGQLDGVSAFRKIKPSTFGRTENYLGIPFYVAKKGQIADVNEIDLLLYKRALHAYPIFQTVCKERGVEGQRLQIGINTIDLLIFGLWTGAPKQLDAFIERTRREAQQIWELTGGNVFFLIESPTATIMANLFRGKEKVLKWYAEAFAKLIQALPAGAGWGFHFCDGRLGGDALGDQGILKKMALHKAIYKPEYTVQMNNYVIRYLEAKGLIPELVQYPLALGSRVPSLDVNDYAAFRGIYLPEATQAYAGAISAKLEFWQQKILFLILDEIFGQRVGMSCTCGHGSDDLATMRACIDLMCRVAYV